MSRLLAKYFLYFVFSYFHWFCLNQNFTKRKGFRFISYLMDTIFSNVVDFENRSLVILYFTFLRLFYSIIVFEQCVSIKCLSFPMSSFIFSFLFLLRLDIIVMIIAVFESCSMSNLLCVSSTLVTCAKHVHCSALTFRSLLNITVNIFFIFCYLSWLVVFEQSKFCI